MTQTLHGQAVRPSLGLLLRHCEHRIRELLQPSLCAAGLTVEHWRIMSVLLDEPGLGMSALAERAVLPSASVTRHMDKLVELGMIVRRVAPDDKRRVVAALSPRGQELSQDLRTQEQQLEERIALRLGADGYEQLTRELAMLPEALD